MKELSAETDRKFQESAQQIKQTHQEIGKLGNRFGELAEHLVAPGIAEKFNELGYHFDYIVEPREIIAEEKKPPIAEIDLLLENGESSIAVEVKSKPSAKDIKEHMRRLNSLRIYKDKHGDKRKIYGALAGAVVYPNIKTAALKAGLYVIMQSGDTMIIDIPEGFKPKAW
jgi:hypothetical protein